MSSDKANNVVRKLHLVHGQPGQDVGAKTLEAERKDYTQEGQEVTGFASSVIPTLEERTIEEQRPTKEKADKGQDEQTGCEERRERDKSDKAAPYGDVNAPGSGDSTLFGVPADAPAPNVDDKPPPRSSKEDNDEEQQAAPAARAAIRNNLTNKSGKKHPWNVLTVKPEVKPEDFEDPLSESFWKDVWVASAVHNVSVREPLLIVYFF